MKRSSLILLVLSFSLLLAALLLSGCADATSDDVQQQQQETMLKEASSQTGMPAIKNFRERKMLKEILELRDQDGLVTFTYIENLNPVAVHGRTALGGKLTYLGETIGYGIPYATQYTNPQKCEWYSGGYRTLPQADPNGLFSPASADGTWILMKDPNGKKVSPVYIEPKIACFPFKLPAD